MNVTPEIIGEKGGQRFPVLDSIRTTVEEMGGGGGSVAGTVLKELLQNADDAGATEVSILLDERDGRRAIELCPELEPLCTPALLVRNNKPFLLPGEASPEDRGDFSGICDVAVGHKRAQATAAGRFGIGFNSVYFLTDTPLLFSRREIHIFDLLHRISIFKGEDGWRFPLDQFPRISGSHAGPIKEILDWCFPTAILESNSLGNIAGDPKGDYRQSVFRLPLRQSLDGSAAIYDDRFRKDTDRRALLWDMVQEATRSVVFLKNVCSISFGILRNREPDLVTTITATASPTEFAEFLKQVAAQAKESGSTLKRECAFDRTVTRLPTNLESVAPESLKTWRFHVRHVARYDEAQLTNLREKLQLNGERAVPWAAVAVPLDVHGCRIDGGETARWRVFLPLLQEGPSACLIHGAFFVGKNRHRTDFRTDGSDEGKRKTEWNKRLFEYAVLPLLQNISADLPDLAPELLDKNPKDYLSLFPLATKRNREETDLTEFARRCFSAGPWELHLKDIWGEPMDLLVGGDGEQTIVEMIPEGLLAYRERFRELSLGRRFVSRVLGEALSARVGPEKGIAFRWQASVDVALKILRHEESPKPQDLEKLLKIVVAAEDFQRMLEGAWAFQETETKSLLRFEQDRLFLVEEEASEPIFTHLRELQLRFEKTAWVQAVVGLPALAAEIHPAIQNILKPDATGAVELLRRLPADNKHDQVSNAHELKPVVEFLSQQPLASIAGSLRLGFLVRTQMATLDRREAGVVLLKPEKPTLEDEAFWEIFARKVFAQVDPECTHELHKLLAAHPHCLEMLHASDCRVALAYAKDSLEILHTVRLSHPDLYPKLAAAMAEISDHRPEVAIRFATFLLETADANWSEMDCAWQYTVLALPIHRCADGRFVSLVPPSGGDVDAIALTFRLQSQDDIKDAPIATVGKTLLQTPKSTVKRFYRGRLVLEEHGRVAVLKDILRQIGDTDRDNLTLLRYLTLYYSQTLDERGKSGDECDKADARELQGLMAEARIVPCLDGKWTPAQKCGEAWEIADHLAAQGWPTKQLTSLLSKLLSGESIASIDLEVRELLPRLHRLTPWGTRRIPELAITSESPELSLVDRAKLFWDNRRDFPEAGVTRSKSAGRLQVPALGDGVTIAEAELLVGTAELPSGLLSLLAPKAVALGALATQLAVQGVQVTELPTILRAFQVTELTAQDLEERLVARFCEVWPDLGQEDRMRVLQYIDTRGLAGRLADKAKGLKTVLVGARRPEWEVPTRVLTPRWTRTKPPHVAEDSQPALESMPEAVLRVWQVWCGIQIFGDVFALVTAGAAAQALEKKGAAKSVYAWLEKAVAALPTDEERSVLTARSWVLAERGECLEFKKPPEVLAHPGEKILGARFWVPARPLPAFCKPGTDSFGFTTAPDATSTQLEEIGECLVERADAEEKAAVKVYELVVQLLEKAEALGNQWRSIAERRPVFCTYRDRERPVASRELFIGDNEYKEDLSSKLVRLKSSPKVPAGIIEHYRKLGVEDCPSVSQVIAALGAITASERNAAGSYARLIHTLHKLTEDEKPHLTRESLGAIRILTCAGSYEKISDCYWDDDLGRQERVLAEHANLLVDTTDKSTRTLREWFGEHGPDMVSSLRLIAQIDSADVPSPVPIAAPIEDLLYPWRQWLKDVGQLDSAVRSALIELGSPSPGNEIQIIPVDRIRIRYRLKNERVIEQSPGWQGPVALGLAEGHLLFRVQALEMEPQRASYQIGEVDSEMAREVGRLLSGPATDAVRDLVVEKILNTLERPSTVLRLLNDSHREHFLHQYYDQVADPHFAKLFDEFRRTDRRKQKAEDLKSEMFDLLMAKFVKERAEQIRGYGYDEFSVFAELMQNAEDAYLQGKQIEMQTPQPFWIAYRYLEDEQGNRVLEVEHQGRPFNHGSRQEPNFGNDVEGVLRSAGSFKPHVDIGAGKQTNHSAIGRFGLGFKSVYLLTDCPEIHSGPWHFVIKAGCLPEELPRIPELPQSATRIRLPLRSEVSVLDRAERLLNLLPFLSMVTDVRFLPLKGDPARIQVASEVILKDENVTVEQLTIALQGIARQSPVRLLRCRSKRHNGQLALVLNEAGIPVRWDEAFEHDVFVALPLQAKLSCGIGVSHRFEVQSGRTHLVDPAKNIEKMDQVANLLEVLVDGLLSQPRQDVSPAELLRRFWALWKWNEGDSECQYLCRALARVLAQLAERKRIVPTLDPVRPAVLRDSLCFYFNQIPDRFRDAVVDARVRIPIAAKPPQEIERGVVVEAGFAAAYARTCVFGEVPQSSSLCGIGWAEVSKAFRDSPWFAEKPELLNCLAACRTFDVSC